MITLTEVQKDLEVETYITQGNQYLRAMGFTEHGHRHVKLVSSIAYNILERLGSQERDRELAAIAGYLHDIGNVAGRHNHAQAGALMAFAILRRLGMDPKEVARVVSAIGNHEEGQGRAVSPVAAALILADKSDVHRSRVYNQDPATFDIHDRVNFAVEKSFLRVEPAKKSITLELSIATKISPVVEYFEIFLSRMLMCQRAALVLGCRFELEVNGNRLL